MSNQPAFNPPSRLTVTTDDLKLIKDMQRGYDSREWIDLYGVKFMATALSVSAAFPASATMRAEEVRMIDPLPWSGDGLPPIGATCTYKTAKEQLRVFAIDGDYAAVASEFTKFWCLYDDLKPIRTPKQIAADERAEAIEELTAGHTHSGALTAWAERAYDHLGYRKQEKPE